MLKASKHEANLKMRSPFRVVADDDVDRRQVHGRQRPQPSRTNHPKAFLARYALQSIAACDASSMNPGQVPVGRDNGFRGCCVPPMVFFKSSQPRHMSDAPYGLKGKDKVVIA